MSQELEIVGGVIFWENGIYQSLIHPSFMLQIACRIHFRSNLIYCKSFLLHGYFRRHQFQIHMSWKTISMATKITHGYKTSRLYHQYATKCGHKLVRSYNLEILNLGYCTFSTVHAELGIRKCFMKLHNDTISPNNLFLRKLDISNKKIHCDSLKYLITTKFCQI